MQKRKNQATRQPLILIVTIIIALTGYIFIAQILPRWQLRDAAVIFHEAYDGKAYARGIDELSTYLSFHSDDASAYGYRARLMALEGRYADAQRDIDAGFALDGADPIIHFAMGSLARLQGDYDSALEGFTRAASLDPEFVDAWVNAANSYQALGIHDQALEVYNHALTLEPDSARIYSNRGNSYMYQSDLDAALADYTRAIELDPDYAEAYSNRGNVYQFNQDFDAALSDFNRVIELKPDFAQAYNNRGIVYEALDYTESARDDYTRAIELDPDYANPYWGLGNILLLEEHSEAALEAFCSYIVLAEDPAQQVIDRVNTLGGCD